MEAVFRLWSNVEHFPRFMSHVRRVEALEGRRLSWKTLPGSPVQHAGTVLFQEDPQGGTRVDIRLSYNPVAGALGHAVATLLGENPRQQMDRDLLRMKTFIEQGAPAA